jgi:hypothetical protein
MAKRKPFLHRHLDDQFYTLTIDLEDEEYRVPSPDGTEDGAYYTDDLEDARGTAVLMFERAGISLGGVHVR